MLDEGLRSVLGRPAARRPSPAAILPEPLLDAAARRKSAALMRVNRAGEISAQALYLAQALVAREPATRRHLLEAAAEERDHLAWCSERIRDLGGRNSVLDPFWFAGSAAVGLAAGAAGDAFSLGFVSETERQVEAHLDDHLRRLPERDGKSRLILERMTRDEAHHGTMARLAGGSELPGPVRRIMTIGGGFLRQLAYFL
jgi:ubiquinone biosynthesis monooxygenase Coq7